MQRTTPPWSRLAWIVLVTTGVLAVSGMVFLLVWLRVVRTGAEAHRPAARLQPRAVQVDRGAPESATTPSLTPERQALPEPPPSLDAPVLATTLHLGADDFVVDIFLNGQRVADANRQLMAEVYGATGERVNLTVREGDWLVFNVVNNRLRWGGVCYFGAAGLAEDRSIAFVSEETEQWSVCEDPGDAPRFITERAFRSNQPARLIENPWPGGHKMMAKQVPGWSGQGIWGSPTNRNIWLKFSAPRTH